MVVGSFTAFSSFEILEEIFPQLGGYDLTGETGYTTCPESCQL